MNVVTTDCRGVNDRVIVYRQIYIGLLFYRDVNFIELS